MRFLLILCVIACVISAIMYKKKITVPPSAMAIVMALGILTKGVLPHLLAHHTPFLFLLTLIASLCCGLWVSFFISFIIQGKSKSFRLLFIENHNERFSVGTWVAGTSICSLLLAQHPSLVRFSDVIFYINSALWLIYILVSGKTWIELIKWKRWSKVHGIILLTTVSTESLVVLINSLYKNVPALLNECLVIIGLSFYVFSLVFLMLRYAPRNNWTLEDDWSNTNCIIHGALSITGLSMTLSHSFSSLAVSSLWVTVGIYFILIEGIEIVRVVRRVNRDGWERGIFTYHPSQWSRLFTLGMFFNFTSMSQFKTSFLIELRQGVLIAGGWVVVVLVLLEVVLWGRIFLSSSSESVLLSKGEPLN